MYDKICMYWVIDKAEIFHIGTWNNANSLLKYNTTYNIIYAYIFLKIILIIITIKRNTIFTTFGFML